MVEYIFYSDLICNRVTNSLGLDFICSKKKYQKTIEHIFDNFYRTLHQISSETIGIIPSYITNDEILTIVCEMVLIFQNVSDLNKFQSIEIVINWFWDNINGILTN